MINTVTERVFQTRDSILKKYDRWLKRKTPFRNLVRYLHTQLNRIQYDPLNPENRTVENPNGFQTLEEKEVADRIERDKTLLDKVETYFRLRPVSTSILAFFVISAAAANARNNPEKIFIALAIIFLILPLLTSRQDDFDKE